MGTRQTGGQLFEEVRRGSCCCFLAGKGAAARGGAAADTAAACQTGDRLFDVQSRHRSRAREGAAVARGGKRGASVRAGSLVKGVRRLGWLGHAGTSHADQPVTEPRRICWRVPSASSHLPPTFPHLPARC